MRFHTLVLMLMLYGVANAGLPESITVTRGYEDYPPMEFHEGNKLTGFHIELIEAVSSQLGIDVKFVSLPWKRAMHWAYKGDADAVSYFTETPARAKKLIFLPDNVLSITRISIIRNKNSASRIIFEGDLNVLKHREMVIPLGFKYGEPFDSFPFERKTEMQTIDMIVNLVTTRPSVIAILNKEEFFFHNVIIL